MSTTLPVPSIDEILQDYEYNPEQVESISPRRKAHPLAIVDPRPADWSARYTALETKIRAALPGPPPLILAVDHVGSTSVAGLPAKDVIDIDLTVADPADEVAYVPALERHGFHFKNRETAWHGHRFFLHYGGDDEGEGEGGWCNLHVWGPGCPETVRHLLLRDWLRAHGDDREAYARIKREAAEATCETGGNVMDYNQRKQDWIRKLLRRIFVAEGYLCEDGQRAK